jgi:hypothetical protein
MIISIIDSWSATVGMSRSQLVSTIGAAFGFLGASLLAFAAVRELHAHRLAISAFQLGMEPVKKQKACHQVTRIDDWNSWWMRAGIVLLGLSFLLTVAAFLLPSNPSPTSPFAPQHGAPPFRGMPPFSQGSPPVNAQRNLPGRPPAPLAAPPPGQSVRELLPPTRPPSQPAQTTPAQP